MEDSEGKELEDWSETEWKQASFEANKAELQFVASNVVDKANKNEANDKLEKPIVIESAKKGKSSFGSASNKLDQPHYTVGSYTIVCPLAANKKMQLPENATKSQRETYHRWERLQTEGHTLSTLGETKKDMMLLTNQMSHSSTKPIVVERKIEIDKEAGLVSHEFIYRMLALNELRRNEDDHKNLKHNSTAKLFNSDGSSRKVRNPYTSVAVVTPVKARVSQIANQSAKKDLSNSLKDCTKEDDVQVKENEEDMRKKQCIENDTKPNVQENATGKRSPSCMSSTNKEKDEKGSHSLFSIFGGGA